MQLCFPDNRNHTVVFTQTVDGISITEKGIQACIHMVSLLRFSTHSREKVESLHFFFHLFLFLLLFNIYKKIINRISKNRGTSVDTCMIQNLVNLCVTFLTVPFNNMQTLNVNNIPVNCASVTDHYSGQSVTVALLMDSKN